MKPSLSHSLLKYNKNVKNKTFVIENVSNVYI